jgi:hypothetical protein
MQATRFGLLARGLAFLTIAFASCSDGDEAVGDRRGGAGEPSCTACGGETAEGGNGPSSSGGPQTIQPLGGSTAAGSGGTSAGAGKTPGGEGGGPPDEPRFEELSLCDRLSQVPAKNLSTTKMFELGVYTDCRIDWLAHLYVDAKRRDDYLNDLLTWNQKFWGCQEVPVEDFLLVWGTPALSQGDANLVIDYYVAAAIEHLELIPREEQEMREALARLSTQVITSSSLEPSKPSCTDANGGAGGQGGLGGATSGAGGELGLAGSIGGADAGGAPGSADAGGAP